MYLINNVYVYFFPWKNVILSCLHNAGERLLLYVVEGLLISSDNPLDFYNEIKSVLPVFLKYLYIGWNTK